MHAFEDYAARIRLCRVRPGGVEGLGGFCALLTEAVR